MKITDDWMQQLWEVVSVKHRFGASSEHVSTVVKAKNIFVQDIYSCAHTFPEHRPYFSSIFIYLKMLDILKFK